MLQNYRNVIFLHEMYDDESEGNHAGGLGTSASLCEYFGTAISAQRDPEEFVENGRQESDPKDVST